MAVAQRMRWLAYIPLRVALLLGVMALGLLGVVQADSRSQPLPLTPAAFFGTLTIAGSPAVVGTVVCGRIGGVDKGCITTTVAGEYGGAGAGDPKLIVQSGPLDIDATIQFFVTPPGTVGGLASQTGVFLIGIITVLDLSLPTKPADIPPTPTPTSRPSMPPRYGANRAYWPFIRVGTWRRTVWAACRVLVRGKPRRHGNDRPAPGAAGRRPGPVRR